MESLGLAQVQRIRDWLNEVREFALRVHRDVSDVGFVPPAAKAPDDVWPEIHVAASGPSARDAHLAAAGLCADYESRVRPLIADSKLELELFDAVNAAIENALEPTPTAVSWLMEGRPPPVVLERLFSAEKAVDDYEPHYPDSGPRQSSTLPNRVRHADRQLAEGMAAGWIRDQPESPPQVFLEAHQRCCVETELEISQKAFRDAWSKYAPASWRRPGRKPKPANPDAR